MECDYNNTIGCNECRNLEREVGRLKAALDAANSGREDLAQAVSHLKHCDETASARIDELQCALDEANDENERLRAIVAWLFPRVGNSREDEIPQQVWDEADDITCEVARAEAAKGDDGA